ncbi:MAG TPA: helix-turn-helix domain-containing protein [Naasia sp.]
MARTPGRQTNEPDDDAPILQVDELSFFDVGRTLQELATQLRGVADQIDNGDIRRLFEEAEEIGVPEAFEVADKRAKERFERTLVGLRSFRRNYDYWERVIAEYALGKQGMTQREVARLLGVSTATINRWAQHPVLIEPKR